MATQVDLTLKFLNFTKKFLKKENLKAAHSLNLLGVLGDASADL